MKKSVIKAIEAEELKLHLHHLHYDDDHTSEQFEDYMNTLEEHMFELNRLNCLLGKFK